MTSRDDLVAATGGDDAFARLDPPARLAGWVLTGRVEASEHAVAFVRTSARRAPSLTTWGPGVTVLLRALRDAGETGRHDVASVTVPTRVAGTAGTAGAGGTAADVFDLGDGGNWHWAWTDRAPAPAPGEADLVELDDHADAARLEAFGFAHNPLFEGFPGTGQSTSWLAALADDGSLLACGAVQRLPSGVAHLGGIVVARHARRRGLGRAVSAALTRRVVDTEGVCTLGLYADNTAARALYASLGYVTDKRWTSRRLRTPHPSI